MQQTFITRDNRQYPLWNSVEEVLEELIPLYSRKTKEKRRQRGWMFRGQSDAKWNLIPTLFREPCTQSTIDERQRYTDSFMKALSEQASTLGLPELDKFKLLATAQHYGFPTQLIDFTYNVEIAAFFATASNPTNSEVGVIYGFSLDEYGQMRNPFSVWGTSQEEADKILRDSVLQPLPPFLLINADEVPRIRVEEAVFIKMSKKDNETVMHHCIDRFYFRQEPGHCYRGGLSTYKHLYPGRESFDSDLTYEMFMNDAKRQNPEHFKKHPFIFDQLYLENDRVAIFAKKWKKENQKSQKAPRIFVDTNTNAIKSSVIKQCVIRFNRIEELNNRIGVPGFQVLIVPDGQLLPVTRFAKKIGWHIVDAVYEAPEDPTTDHVAMWMEIETHSKIMILCPTRMPRWLMFLCYWVGRKGNFLCENEYSSQKKCRSVKDTSFALTLQEKDYKIFVSTAPEWLYRRTRSCGPINLKWV